MFIVKPMNMKRSMSTTNLRRAMSLYIILGNMVADVFGQIRELQSFEK